MKECPHCNAKVTSLSERKEYNDGLLYKHQSTSTYECGAVASAFKDSVDGAEIGSARYIRNCPKDEIDIETAK